MIKDFDMAGHPELVTTRLLKLIEGVNIRMDEVESACNKGAINASCGETPIGSS